MILRGSAPTAKQAPKSGSALPGRCCLPIPAIQEISARVGRVTGRGIAGDICRHYPGWMLQGIVALLLIANVINLGADLGAMADATRLLIGGPQAAFVVILGTVCVIAQVFVRYSWYVRVLK